jgi:hypothetical protein
MSDPRTDALWQRELQQQQAAEAAAVREVQTFIDSKEFGNDVKEDMADLIAMADQRGVDLTLEDAYSRAIAINPDVQKVISGRAQAESAQGQQQSIRRKKRAAKQLSSGSPSPASEGSKGSLEDDLNAAWDNAVSG